MNTFLSALPGVGAIIGGIFVFKFHQRIAKVLQGSYDVRNRRYDERIAQSGPLKKVLVFLFCRPRTYYMNETTTASVLRFIAPLIILWGVLILFIGFGIGD